MRNGAKEKKEGGGRGGKETFCLITNVALPPKLGTLSKEDDNKRRRRRRERCLNILIPVIAIERFSNECPKTKTKVANQKGRETIQ